MSILRCTQCGTLSNESRLDDGKCGGCGKQLKPSSIPKAVESLQSFGPVVLGEPSDDDSVIMAIEHLDSLSGQESKSNCRVCAEDRKEYMKFGGLPWCSECGKHFEPRI